MGFKTKTEMKNLIEQNLQMLSHLQGYENIFHIFPLNLFHTHKGRGADPLYQTLTA